jgi:hypothetical protein
MQVKSRARLHQIKSVKQSDSMPHTYFIEHFKDVTKNSLQKYNEKLENSNIGSDGSRKRPMTSTEKNLTQIEPRYAGIQHSGEKLTSRATILGSNAARHIDPTVLNLD